MANSINLLQINLINSLSLFLLKQKRVIAQTPVTPKLLKHSAIELL